MSKFTGKLSELSTDLAQFNFDNCTHEFKHFAGWSQTKNSKKRLRCSVCKLYFTEGKIRLDRIVLLSKIAPLFKLGYSVPKAAEKLGHNKRTILRYFKWINAKLPDEHKRAEPFTHFDSSEMKRNVWKNRTYYRKGGK